MLHISRKDLVQSIQPGRICSVAVSPSDKENVDGMLAAFAVFSYKYGKMDSHYHENEYMYIIDAKDATVSYGMDLNHLKTEPLKAGEIIRPVTNEWHRFDFGSEEGYADFINFFPAFPPHTVNSSDFDK